MLNYFLNNYIYPFLTLKVILVALGITSFLGFIFMMHKFGIFLRLSF